MTSSDSNLTLSWKRPWTIEEIIQSSQCWSLAADSGVCELLKSFSTDLLNEVAQVNNNINELSVESKQTNVIIQNAFNEFCMLANNQFMENLVEDVASCPITNENIKNNEPNQSKEDKLAQIIPQVTESLKMGFQVLESQFEMMDMQKMAATTASPEDSDTEMRSYAQVDYLTNEPIYHPKDPYENRHLPHLIGTKAFIEDETLGIGYLDDLENKSEYDSARSQPVSVSDGLSSNPISDDEAESDDNQPAGMRKVSSSSENDPGMFSSDNPSEEDLFNEDNKVSTSIKKTDSSPSLTKPLSIMDQLNNQLKQRLGVENIHKPNEQTEDSWQDNDDNQKNDSSSIESHIEDSKKKPLQSSTNHIIRRPASVKSTDEDSDDLFGEVPTQKMKNESKPVSNSITQMPSVITSTPNNVDKNSNAKQKEEPKSKKPFYSNSLPDSDSDDLFEPKLSIPKPVVRSRKSNSKDITKESIDRTEKENQLVKEVPAKVIPTKKQPVPESDSDDDDDLFKPKVSQPAKSTASVANPVAKPVVKPVLKQANSNLFNSDDDADDLFNTTSKGGKPPPAQTAEKSTDVTILPKVESDNKINTKALKDEAPKPKSFSKWLDSSSDDDLLLPKSKHIVVSKPLNDDKPVKQEIVEIKVVENIKNEDVKEINQTNNSNSSTNNLDEFNEDKNIDDFDDLFNTNKIIENKTSPSGFNNSNIITDELNVSNNSKVIDPLAPPKRKIPFNISSNSDEYESSNKSPEIIPRNSPNKIPHNSTGSGVLDASSPENSNSNTLDIVSEVKSARDSLPKLPPGAKSLFGPSLMDEMKSHQKSKLSLNSETETDVKNSSHLFTPDKIDLFGSSENQTESNIQSNKQDFKNKLQLKLNEKPFRNTVERVNKPEISDENGINLEVPAEEVHQLNLLTKSRVKANPRRRPTMKKAGNGDTIPTLDPIIPENQTDSIPQPIVDSVSSIVDSVSPIVDSVSPIIASNQSDDTSNIFADLPTKPNKKTKSNKKSTALSTNKTKKPVEVNAEEIDDIFNVATSKPKKAKNKSKIVSDPLGAI